VPFFFKQSAALRTEVGTALVEADGSKIIWHQYPCELLAPIQNGQGAQTDTLRDGSDPKFSRA
jgi:hypothetical protein